MDGEAFSSWFGSPAVERDGDVGGRLIDWERVDAVSCKEHDSVKV